MAVSMQNRELVRREEWVEWVADFKKSVRDHFRKKDFRGIAADLIAMDPEIMPAESSYHGPYIIESREFYHAQLIQVLHGAGKNVGQQTLQVLKQELREAKLCVACLGEKESCSTCSGTGRAEENEDDLPGAICFLKKLTPWLEKYVAYSA